MFRRCLLLGVLWAMAATGAHAHFVFVTPQEDGKTARVVMSDDLLPDLDVKSILGTKLQLLTADGIVHPLTLEQAAKNYLSVGISGEGTRVVFGKTEYGVVQRGESDPFLLVYYPKTIVGNGLDGRALLGDRSPVELIPVGTPGAIRLKLLAHGKPVANEEITVMLPDDTKKIVKTDANGITVETLRGEGHFGAWGRYFEDRSGSLGEKNYQQIRHYATLVFDSGTLATTGTTTSDNRSTSEAPANVAAKFGSLPEATSSFGATAVNDWLYVYGGHTAPTHVYSKEAVSGQFHRMRIDGDGTWEALPGGPGLQGMNLIAYKGLVYRVGGMEPRNEKGKRANNHSVDTVARFHPATKEWESLPGLPEPLSSHDVAIIKDKLYVAGGWRLAGDEEVWSDKLLVLDLNQMDAGWKSVPQPFKRRALMTAAFDNKLWVVGGIGDGGKVTRKVSVYDPASDSWSEAPELPDGRFLGFSPAVAVHGGALYAAVADGQVLRLQRGAAQWEQVATVEGRVAHRMVSVGGKLLVMGGATKGNNLDLVESVPVEALSASR